MKPSERGKLIEVFARVGKNWIRARVRKLDSKASDVRKVSSICFGFSVLKCSNGLRRSLYYKIPNNIGILKTVVFSQIMRQVASKPSFKMSYLKSKDDI